ncbi:MAG: hypothetical protein HGA33_05895 [Candidatus Moranbacteria bacterium]|nr:hypothetical protein [Candidatus Moranbacteria bacterium]
MSLQSYKTGTIKINSQIFWLIGSLAILLFHSALKAETIKAISAIWLAFVTFWIFLAIVMAAFNVAGSRAYARKHSKDIEMFRNFSEYFNLWIVTIPFLGIFVNKINPIRRLSEELSGQVEKARNRNLVTYYSRG